MLYTTLQNAYTGKGNYEKNFGIALLAIFKGTTLFVDITLIQYNMKIT